MGNPRARGVAIPGYVDEGSPGPPWSLWQCPQTPPLPWSLPMLLTFDGQPVVQARGPAFRVSESPS